MRLPARIGIKRLDRSGNGDGVRAEIFFVDHAVLVDDEGHYREITVFGRKCHKREAADHVAVHHIVIGAARRVLTLLRDDPVE